MSNRLTTLTHHHQHDDAEDDETEDSQPVVIFDATGPRDDIPIGFNAVRIPIDGTLQADLNWKDAHQAAEHYINKGLKIFWEIDLGLFHHLKHPLNNQTQFLSLSLSLEHFRDTLWKQFRSETAGLCLYRGNADFSIGYRWDKDQLTNLQGWLQDEYGDISTLNRKMETTACQFEELNPSMLNFSSIGKRAVSLFCRDAAGEYLELLGQRLPDTLKCFILLDATDVSDSLLAAQLTIKERFSRFSVGIKGAQCLDAELAWERPPGRVEYFGRENSSENDHERPNLGVCLPAMNRCHFEDVVELHQAVKVFEEKGIRFRFIPESQLTMEWDGLDYLFVDSTKMNLDCKRKLRGFCAAGGIVINVGPVLAEVPQEISFNDWQKLQNI